MDKNIHMAAEVGPFPIFEKTILTMQILLEAGRE